MRDGQTALRTAGVLLALLAALATPSSGRDTWGGMQLESTVVIDVAQPRSEVALDIPASAFSFKPVTVTVEDRAKGEKKFLKLSLDVKNNSDKDYFIYGTATLLDKEGKVIATKSQKDKIEEDDPEDLAFRFRLPSADLGRIAKCTFRFAFEKD